MRGPRRELALEENDERADGQRREREEVSSTPLRRRCHRERRGCLHWAAASRVLSGRGASGRSQGATRREVLLTWIRPHFPTPLTLVPAPPVPTQPTLRSTRARSLRHRERGRAEPGRATTRRISVDLPASGGRTALRAGRHRSGSCGGANVSSGALVGAPRAHQARTQADLAQAELASPVRVAVQPRPRPRSR